MPIRTGLRRFGKRGRQAIISFGHPTDPNDETSDVLAGDMTAVPAHNGTLDDIDGSWVELEINGTAGTTLDDAITCSHNLFTEEATAWDEEPVTDEPNVRWFVVGWEHDGEPGVVWDDLRVPVSAAKKGVGSPPDFELFQNDGIGPSTGVFLEFFADGKTGDQELFFTAQLPHTYQQGSDIEVHTHWTPKLGTVPAAGEVVSWGLEYTWANVGEDYANTTLIGDNGHYPADATLVPGRHYMTEIGDILGTTGDDKLVSSCLICRVFRDAVGNHAPDTFQGLPAGNHDVGLIEIDFHFQLDSQGSDDEDTKNAGAIPAVWELRDRPFNIYRQTGDDMDANNIDLRVVASPFFQIDNNHPLKVTLFFIKAVK